MQVRRLPLETTQPRSGAVLVENALVMSIFGLFLAGIMEFGHAYMVMGIMNTAVQRGARLGAVNDVTTTEVKDHVTQILQAGIKTQHASVMVKDGSKFDDENVDPKTIDYDNLPNLELDQAERGQMYIVRVTIPYDKVALLPPFWVKNATLKAQSVMRHE